MKISVITVCFNSAATIRSCIESVLSQQGIDLDYVVIDGASEDATPDIVRSYGNRISTFVSEPDKGIYNAMNKGLHLAKGDIVAILNSDDYYARPAILHDVAEAFRLNPDVDIVYGDLEYVDAVNTDHVVRRWISSAFKPGSFKRGWHPPHPSFFVRRSVYERCGLFDEELRIAADYEFMLRLMEKERLNSLYLPGVKVKMRTGGASNRSLKNIWRANQESYLAFKKNGLKAPVWLPLLKPVLKIRQLLT
ncbi:glycosyltransferase family 2 protein [Leptonema illini]|uniref:Glycosyl transferase family 2 n=1 Tax=Leptonema illini DSM 21528 TaxID=929563 RepID=H2CD38_9LEPT|nr:glycosyltransferase family 2 protein [Leptonema illini]EHQ07514.1 glycosyl transferase family 2 [Leptonema illini DSM 21528]